MVSADYMRLPLIAKLSRKVPCPTAGIERLNDPVEMDLNEAPGKMTQRQPTRFHNRAYIELRPPGFL